MSKVSILIAAYNVEEYIAETLNSAIAQTLKDIEIVVVDDCSTDGTLEIITKYASLDSRIKVVKHEINKSVNITRITALENATGEYVMYVDGDDTLTPDACEKAYNAITKEKVDMLQFDFKLYYVSPSPSSQDIINGENFRNALHSATHKMVSISKAGMLDTKAVGEIINFTMWDKIYKKSLLEKAVKHIPHEYLNMAEDVMYSFFIQYYAKSYSYLSEKLYVYRFGCGMSTTRKLSERLMNFIAKNAYIYNYMSEWVKNIGAQDECKQALCRVHKKLYAHILGTYFYALQKSQKQYFISEVTKYVNTDDFVLGLSDFLYSNSISADRLATECAALEMFNSKKTEAKTIGIYYFRIYNGGVENVMSSLMDIWVKAGYNVVLFTDEMPNKDDYYINPAVKRVIVPALNKRDFFNQKERITVFRKALIENNVDVMVYNAWVSPDLAFDEMIIKSCGVNLVIHSHNLFCCETDNLSGHYAYFFSTLPKLYSLADSIIAISDVDAAWWQTMGIRCLKTRNPIKIGIDTKPAELNGNNILFVGRISEEKQVLDAIKIAELVKKEIPDVKLTVVGKGDEPSYIKQIDDYISKNDLSSLVDMVGFKSNVIPYYQSADVMLATSRYEGAPLSWLEGKICGLPLVCYSLPHLDFTRENRGMAIVEQSDIIAAANAIVEILSNKELKKEMGLQARESAENYLSIDLAEHWKNIFAQTLAPKKKENSLYDVSTTEAAVRIAVDKYSSGIFKRAIANDEGYTQRCVELQKELDNFRHSESYRIGMIITFIPRMLKNLLKKLFKRNNG